MDELDICPGESNAIEKIGDTNQTNNPDELNTSVDKDYSQTSEQFSQDLFNDDETNSIRNSPAASIKFGELSEITKGDKSLLDSLISPIQTSKIFGEDRTPAHAIVPTVPISLVPFISTVNESWTSDLETPNAERAASNRAVENLQNGESIEQLKSYESQRRNRCDSIRSNAVLPDATTPNGCFITQMDNECFSSSPILQTGNKRHRPKRRILKSLDTSASTSCMMDLTNIVQPFMYEQGLKPEENIDSEIENKSRIYNLKNDNPVAENYETIFTNENLLLHNSKLQVARDETSFLSQKIDTRGIEDPFVQNNVLDSSLVINPRQDEMKTSLANVGNRCEDKIDERLNEIDKKSLGDRLKEMNKLRRNRPQFGENEYTHIPTEFFTKEAEALEIAEMSPIISKNLSDVKTCRKSDVKSEWGLISFTQMCLLEEKSGIIEPSGQAVTNSQNDPETRVVQVEKTDPVIERIEISKNVEKNELTRSESAAMSLEEDERDIADIFASSFREKDEAVIDVDEFSPWFYQSNETKSDTSKNVNLSSERNLGKVKDGLETTVKTEECGTTNENDKLSECSSRFTSFNEKPFAQSKSGLENNRRKNLEKVLPETSSGTYRREDEDNKGLIPEIISYSSIGFSTASGKPIKVSEDKMRKARKLYDEITAQDGNNCDFTLLDEISEPKDYERKKNNNNKNIGQPVIPENSHNSAGGFFTAGGKAIKISEEKLKQAEKIFAQISAEVNDNLPENLPSVSKSPGVFTTRGIKRKQESDQTCGLNSVVGFTTAHGQSLKVSETAMKKAKLMFDNEYNLDEEIEQLKEFPASKNEPKVTRLVAEPEAVNPKPGNVFCGFSTAGGKSLSISKSALKKAEQTYKNLSDVMDAEDGVAATSLKNSDKELSTNANDHSSDTGKCNAIVRDEASKLFDQNVNLVGESELPGSQSLTGFSTASGIAIRISDAAISKAKMLLAEEEIQCDLKSPSNMTYNENRFVGFSTASGKRIEISDQALSSARKLLAEEDIISKSTQPKRKTENNGEGILRFSKNNNQRMKKNSLSSTFEKENKWLAVEQENTPPNNSSTKRSVSRAIETSTKSNVSVFTTPGFDSPSENVYLTEDAGSVFQRSKKVRLNYDLQGRKLFSEKEGCDTDEEMENVKKFDNEKIETHRAPSNSSNDRAYRFLGYKDRKSVPFTQNNASIMYANPEMLQTTDRLVIPKLKPQKSSPLIVQNDHHRNLRLTETRDKGLANFFDEVTASTEALLADEENSNDARSWASAITCSPTITEEREISMRPITCKENNDTFQEAPTSPIIGDKFRSRKKPRKNRKSLLMKSAVGIEAKTNDRSNRKEIIDEQIDATCSQQSGTTTSTSNSFKELHRNSIPVIEAGLVPKFNEYGESSKNGSVSKSRFEDLAEPISSEIYRRESIADILENRIAVTLEQEKIIRAKKKLKPKPVPGSLYLCKMRRKESRISLRDLTNGIPPTARTPQELIDSGIGLDVIKITAATAASYRLKCADFHSFNGAKICLDVCQLDVGDGGRIILDENGFAGAQEFERAFVASPNVDPNLVPQGWVENHYKWIVWKLAAMDRMKLGRNRMLTPDNIMKQLKYRYDREIDRSQRPALRRIIEKDDPACRRIVLCVANLTKISNDQSPESKSPQICRTSHWKVVLTDGWYSIAASIDAAMEHLISSGKVREGTKLVTYGGELLNCDQGCSPLEIPAEVSLKIHCNSTRRARWDTKLGYCKNAGPIPIPLSTVLPCGGLIGKLDTIIARLYPIQYFEKNPSGQAIFRNDKCEDKAAMIYEEKRRAQIDAIYSKARADFESKSWKDSKNSSSSSIEVFRNEVESILQRNLPPPRKVTPVLRARVIEGENIASLTIWAPSEDIIDVLKEGNRVSLHNLQSSGRRSGELNLTAGRQSFVKYEGSAPDFPRRRLTHINEIAVAEFNPIFGDFDTVGVVVSFGPAPHGMRNFEVVNLAFPNPDSSSSAYLAILFWEGIAAYGFSEILTVGSIVACSNLQWRRGLPRTIPIAYSTEHSTFTRNPRQVHLRSAFDYINDQITDLPSYTAQCANEIANENQKKTIGVRSPVIQESPSKISSSSVSINERSTTCVNQRTPQGTAINTGEITTPAKYSIQKRLEKLQWYGDPPNLSPITLNYSSNKVKQKFIPLVRTPEQGN